MMRCGYGTPKSSCGELTVASANGGEGRRYMKRVALLILLAGSLLIAAPPALKLPKEVKGDVGDFLEVVAETEGKIVQWKALDKGMSLFPVHRLKDTKTAIVVAKKPGRYRLAAVTAVGDEPSEIAETVLIIGDPPAPGPEPDPGPKPGKMWVVVVYDNSQESPPHLTDNTMWDKVSAAGHKWRVLEVKQDDVTSKNYKRFVDSVGGCPALLLMEPNGKLIKATKLPSTTEATLKEIGL